jgi:hypothetical protein
MSRRRTTTTAPAAPVPAADLAGSLQNVAAMTSEACDSLIAMCTATLALIDGTEDNVLTIAQMVLTMRDQLQAFEDTIGAECEAQGCGHVSHRLDDVLARIDRAAAPHNPAQEPHAMNQSDLTTALDVLREAGELTRGFHPEHKLAGEATQMQLVLSLASLYLADLGKQIVVEGRDPADALLVVLEGKTKLPPEAVAALEEGNRLSLN